MRVLGGCLCACVVLAASADAARSETAITIALAVEPPAASEGTASPPLFGRVPIPRMRPAKAPHPPAPNSPQDVCDTIAASARQHRLPIAFFGNLIYQESGMKPRVVSRAGARGIAQFMPKTARMVGLKNPFNPREALPASAKFLRGLLHRFGNNYGLAAAAYNAGPGRVSRWLKRGGGLPQETRKYVLTITGKRADQWRGVRGNNFGHDLTGRIPCSNLKAFANLENNPASAHSLRPVTLVLPMPLPNPLRPAQQTALAGGGSDEQPQLAVNIEMKLPAASQPARSPEQPAAQATAAPATSIAVRLPPIPRPAPHRPPEPAAIATAARVEAVEGSVTTSATKPDSAPQQIAMIAPAESAAAGIQVLPTPRPALQRLADYTGSIGHVTEAPRLNAAIKVAPLPRAHPHRIAGRAVAPGGKSIQKPPLPRVHPLRMAQVLRQK